MSSAPAPDPRPGVLTVSLTAGSGYGGAEKIAYEFALRLDPDRFRSHLCTIQADHHTRAESHARDRRELAARGVSNVSLNQPGPALVTPRGWARLASLMVRESIDIVHAHMPRASIPAALLARLTGVPVIVSHEHGSALAGRRLRPWLDREVVARLSTVMIAVSEWDRNNLIAHEGIPAEVIRVLPNGISAPEVVSAASPLQRRPGRHLIGAVGRLYPEKGYEDLVQAVRRLNDRGVPVDCVIVGDGPNERQLQALIDTLGLTEEVRLLGRREDVPAILGMLDAAVLSSVREGSPLAMLEYMAAGAPIVATAVGGVPELVRDGEHGVLVPAATPDGLADGIERVISDRRLAQRLGAAARARQAGEYDLDVVLRRLQAMYDDLLEHERADGARRVRTALAER